MTIDCKATCGLQSNLWLYDRQARAVQIASTTFGDIDTAARALVTIKLFTSRESPPKRTIHTRQTRA